METWPAFFLKIAIFPGMKLPVTIMKTLLAIICLLNAHLLLGQSAQDNKEILIPINDLFKAMNAGDSALLHSCFVSEPTLVTGADGKWRIFHLADTRQKDGCNVPPAIANSLK